MRIVLFTQYLRFILVMVLFKSIVFCNVVRGPLRLTPILSCEPTMV